MKFFIFFFVSFFFAAASAADIDYIQQIQKQNRDLIGAMELSPDQLPVELIDDQLASESLMREILVDEPILQNDKVPIEQQFLIDQNIRWQELENQRFLRKQLTSYKIGQFPMMRNYMERQYMPMRNQLDMQLLNMDMPLEMRQRRISPLNNNQMIREMLMRNPKWETLYNYPRSYSWVPEPYEQIMNSY